MENVCRFIGHNPVPEIIQTLNYVHEKSVEQGQKLSAVYRACIVISGSAKVSVASSVQTLKRGDVFFIFPACTYQIASDKDFSYMYISYIGIRASALMERFNINVNNCFFTNCHELIAVWENGISRQNSVLDIITESVLLSTLAFVGERNCEGKESCYISPSLEKFLEIKKYIDDNLGDKELSASTVAHRFSYNSKYVSSAFKRYFKIGIAEYINSMRISMACRYIENGMTVVSDVAEKCGFEDTSYFSKVFKKHTALSPKEYMETFTD